MSPAAENGSGAPPPPNSQSQHKGMSTATYYQACFCKPGVNNKKKAIRSNEFPRVAFPRAPMHLVLDKPRPVGFVQENVAPMMFGACFIYNPVFFSRSLATPAQGGAYQTASAISPGIPTALRLRSSRPRCGWRKVMPTASRGLDYKLVPAWSAISKLWSPGPPIFTQAMAKAKTLNIECNLRTGRRG